MHEILTERLSAIGQALARIDQAISRVEGNQNAIISNDRNSYHLIHRSLLDAQTDISLIAERQVGIQTQATRLTRIESLLEYAMGLLQRMISDQGQALGRVEASQAAFSESLRPQQPTWVKLGERFLEFAPKLAANWAPIMAAIVAVYKWGLPYLRAFLGSP